MPIWIIARHSFKEAIRKRILVVAGIFALALVVSAPFWPAMTDSDRVKLVQDISLTAMTFLGVIIAVFISAYSLPSDVEERRIFTLASKPVRRHEILLGKLCGFLMVFAAVLALMGLLGNIVIRSVSTFSRVEVTAAEAPILINGLQIGAVGKGRELRITSTEGEYYSVVLPEDQTLKEAHIAASDVEVDKTSGQVRVTADGAALTRNGVEIAYAERSAEFAVKDLLDGSYTVYLPENLRIRRALVPASHMSAPRRSLIRAKRIVDPVGRVYRNQGAVRYEEDALVFETAVSKIGEIWRFAGIDADKLPAGEDVRVLMSVPGIYGVATDAGAPGRLGGRQIKEFDVALQITHPGSGRLLREAKAKAVWAERSFTMDFDLPRESLLGGAVDVTITHTDPQFLHLSTDFFSKRRTVTWHFEDLKMGRFGSEGKIRGEMLFELRRGNMPADGSAVAHVEFKIAPPSGLRNEIITVPIRSRKRVEFEFSREMIDPHGNVNVAVHKVPEPYAVGVPAKGATVSLLEKPVSFERSYFKAIALIFCQLALVGSASVAASTFVSGGVAALVGFFTYFCGQAVSLMNDILRIGPQAFAGHHHGPAVTPEGGGASWALIEPLLKVFVTVTPDASKLDAKEFILRGMDVPCGDVLAGIARTAAYLAVFMVFACFVFRRKELG